MHVNSAPTTLSYRLEGFGFDASITWSSPQEMQQQQEVEIILLLNRANVCIHWQHDGLSKCLPLDLNRHCVLPTNQWHTYKKDQSAKFIRLFFHPAQCKLMTYPDHPDIPFELTGQYCIQDPFMRSIAVTLHSFFERDTYMEALYLDSLIHRLTMHILKTYASLDPVDAQHYTLPHASWLRDVVNYIQTHLDQELRLSRLAAIAQMEENCFFELFKEAMDLSPFRYLLRERIFRVKELIYIGHRSLSEIANICGFQNQNHLQQRFWQTTGIELLTYLESAEAWR